ncbi:MAG: DUF6602 domain-containing protein (plasmid) [Leptolyngbya sp. BL-A-14]
MEYVVRSYLRRRIPKRFEISTGFISTLETNRPASGALEVTRNVSRQFDVLIWDADAFPPLFRADDFVVVVPESVRAVIEVTKCLDAAKAREDLGKFDDLYEMYSPERQRFRPYTGILAFSSKHRMPSLLQMLERFYLFDSNIPIPFRYHAARIKGRDVRPLALPGFIDSLCVVDQGLIKGKMETALIEPLSSVVRYVAYANEPHIDASFGFFERDIVLTLSQSAAEASGSWESSVDVYREFMHAVSHKACSSLIIEDWNSVFPSLNVLDKGHPITPHFPSDIMNASKFVGADFVADHPRPAMYIEDFGPNIWAFERHPENVFACGPYAQGNRVKSWNLFTTSDEVRQRGCIHRVKMGESSFSKILETFKATAWRDAPEHDG